ncbi:MAG: reprolysin-like metallopeptidase [Halioglobus sp.]
MNMKNRMPTLLAIILICYSLAAMPVTGAEKRSPSRVDTTGEVAEKPAPGRKAFKLFEPVQGEPKLRANGKPMPLGHTRVKVNSKLASAKKGDSLEFHAANGVVHVFSITSVEKSQGGNRYISAKGSVDESFARVMFSPSGGLRGQIQAGGLQYLLDESEGEAVAISAAEAGLEANAIIDELQAPPASSDVGSESISAVASESNVGAANSSSISTISLMVLYEPSISNAALTVDYLVSRTNDIYRNSDIQVQFELAAIEPLSYGSAKAVEALNYITQNPSVASLREIHRADMVVFLRPYDFYADRNCGIAWLTGSNGGSMNASEARRMSFSVVKRGTSSNGYYCSDETLAHELGHNLGVAHDYENSGSHTPYYSYAYGDGIDGTFGTVMSYLHPEIGRFSNPRMTGCNGYYCGVDGYSDAARAINNVRSIYANIYSNAAPEPPVATGASAGVGEISVSFSPGATGGSPVSYYLANCDGATRSSSTSPIIVAGLAYGSRYSCSVTAVNGVGSSLPSNSVAATTKYPPDDSDGDGWKNSVDAFPNDPSEWKDSDGDGVGDNSDAFPNDSTESSDWDGDGVGDNSDAYPYDPNRSESAQDENTSGQSGLSLPLIKAIRDKRE